METPDGDVFEVDTTDGRYRCQVLIVAVGVAEPFTPPGLGMEFTHHYAEVRPVETYADHRILLIGKQNSGFELATGLLPWARQIVLTSPSRARLSVETKTLVGVRARYVQPYEDSRAGRRGQRPGRGGRPDRAGRRRPPDRLPAAHRRRAGPDDRGRRRHLRDRLRLPAAGPARPRCRDVRGEPPARPDAVVGERPGARDLLRGDDRAGLEGPPEARRAGQLRGRPRGPLQRPRAGRRTSPRRTSGSGPKRPHLAPDDVTGFIATELAEAPELFHQRGYLARVLTADPAGGMRDEGVQPLAHVLDAGGPDAIAATLEGDGSGAIYPVVYTRIGGKVVEQAIEPDPLMRVDTVDSRRLIAELVGRVMTR